MRLVLAPFSLMIYHMNLHLISMNFHLIWPVSNLYKNSRYHEMHEMQCNNVAIAPKEMEKFHGAPSRNELRLMFWSWSAGSLWMLHLLGTLGELPNESSHFQILSIYCRFDKKMRKHLCTEIVSFASNDSCSFPPHVELLSQLTYFWDWLKPPLRNEL